MACGLFLQRNAAEKILQLFQDHPDSWTRVDGIIEQTQNLNSKFFALRVSTRPPHTYLKLSAPLPCASAHPLFLFLGSELLPIFLCSWHHVCASSHLVVQLLLSRAIRSRVQQSRSFAIGWPFKHMMTCAIVEAVFNRAKPLLFV